MKVDVKTITSFITELRVICDYENFFSNLNLCGFITRIFMSIYLSYFTDTVGRCPVYYFVMFLLFICHASYYFIKTPLVAFINVGLGISNYHMYYVNGIIGSEYLSPGLASIHISAMACTCALCGLFMIVIMVTTSNTNYIYGLSWVGTIIMAYLSKNFVKETPTFLKFNKRYKELEENSKEIAIYNDTEEAYKKSLSDLERFKLTCPPEVFKQETSVQLSILQTIYVPFLNFYEIFRTNEMITEVLLLTVKTLTLNTLYWGMLINAEKIEGNIYVNLAMILIGELIAEAGAGYLLLHFSKRKLMYTSYAYATLMCAIYLYTDSQGLKNFLVFATTLGVAMNYVVVSDYIYAYFDPDIKTTVTAWTQLVACLWLAITPMILSMFSDAFQFYLICGIIATVCAFLLGDKRISKNPPPVIKIPVMKRRSTFVSLR
jgi:hypothetical protein